MLAKKRDLQKSLGAVAGLQPANLLSQAYPGRCPGQGNALGKPPEKSAGLRG